MASCFCGSNPFGQVVLELYFVLEKLAYFRFAPDKFAPDRFPLDRFALVRRLLLKSKSLRSIFKSLCKTLIFGYSYHHVDESIK